MSDFTELLTAVSSGAAAGIALAAVLIVRGHLTITLRRKPQPAKPKEPTP